MTPKLESAYERLAKAALNILELSEPDGNGEVIVHVDNYDDLDEAYTNLTAVKAEMEYND